MSRLPIPHIINTIKTKLGFDRTMTASGEDVVDAVNKQSQQIDDLSDQLATQNIQTGIAGITAKLNNKTVSLFLSVSNPDQSANGWITLGTLPKSLRPTTDIQTTANINRDITTLTIRIQTNGLIQYYHFSVTPTIDMIVGLITFIL